MRETTTVRRPGWLRPRPGWPRPRPVRPAGWWYDGLLLLALVGITLALADGYLLGLDLAVREWVFAHQPAPAYWTARTFNFLGQGGWLLMPLAGGLAVAVGLRTRSVRPLLVPAAAFVLTYLTIGPAKVLTDRAAPTSKLAPEESVKIFNTLPPGEYDMSFPAGHVANGIVWYGVIALLLAALLRAYGRTGVSSVTFWLIRVLPPAILLCTTTYLGFHWFTDSIAGLLLGLLLDRLMARVPWDDVPLPGLPYGVDRPGVFTQQP